MGSAHCSLRSLVEWPDDLLFEHFPELSVGRFGWNILLKRIIGASTGGFAGLCSSRLRSLSRWFMLTTLKCWAARGLQDRRAIRSSVTWFPEPAFAAPAASLAQAI